MPYHQLYEASPDHILWGDQPGRLVARIKDYLSQGKVLDAGCGDGKNALFLEREGFDVVGFDLSSYALQGLEQRFSRARQSIKGNYQVRDITTVHLEDRFDALVSYGLFHCLPEQDRVRKHLQLTTTIREGGYLLFTCLTNDIPLPEGHTPGVRLAKPAELAALFEGMEIIYEEQGTIVESHLPSIGQHEHSAIWRIARR